MNDEPNWQQPPPETYAIEILLGERTLTIAAQSRFHKRILPADLPTRLPCCDIKVGDQNLLLFLKEPADGNYPSALQQKLQSKAEKSIAKTGDLTVFDFALRRALHETS